MEIKISYKNLIVFYFSGTGNAKLVSEWIVEEALNMNIEAKVYCISDIKNINEIRFHESSLVGFCYPTHGFNAPPNIIKFIRKFSKGKMIFFF